MFRIFGPPGTGKTTRLLNMVDNALQDGVSPDRIAFLAFTRKAANEAKERAADRFDLTFDDLPFFRTLHSFAYRTLSVQKHNLMQKDHFDDLSNKIGVALNVTNDMNIEDGPAVIEHEVLSLINLSRLKKTSLRQEYNDSSVELPCMRLITSNGVMLNTKRYTVY